MGTTPTPVRPRPLLPPGPQLPGQGSGVVDVLDETVRSVVRREGVDPQRDATVVRRIAESVVREHDERSLTGQVAPVGDAERVVGELVARVAGFGPLQPLLDDPSVEDVRSEPPTTQAGATTYLPRTRRWPGGASS